MEALTHWVCLLFFLKISVDVMTPCLSVVFRLLVRPGSFPTCWRQANVTPIPRGLMFTSFANYRPISITSVLSKVFERPVSVRLGQFVERSGGLPTTQSAYRNGLGSCDAPLCVSHTLQSSLESGRWFSAAFDRVIYCSYCYCSSWTPLIFFSILENTHDWLYQCFNFVICCTIPRH